METLQLLFNVCLSFVVLLFGWWNRLVWESLKELRSDKEQHHKEFNEFRILVANNYIQKENLEKLFDSINKQLDKLSELDLVFSKEFVTKEVFDKSIDTLLIKLEKIENRVNGEKRG
jgi:Tfp pilus assembly protein PilO